MIFKLVSKDPADGRDGERHQAGKLSETAMGQMASVGTEESGSEHSTHRERPGRKDGM